jgi:hypothetical protein
MPVSLEEQIEFLKEQAKAFEDVKVIGVRIEYITGQLLAVRQDLQEMKKTIETRMEVLDKEFGEHLRWSTSKMAENRVELEALKNNPAVVKTDEWMKNHERVHSDQEGFHRWMIGTIIGIIVAIGTIASVVAYAVMH